MKCRNCGCPVSKDVNGNWYHLRWVNGEERLSADCKHPASECIECGEIQVICGCCLPEPEKGKSEGEG